MNITCLETEVFKMMLEKAQKLAERLEGNPLRKDRNLTKWLDAQAACTLLHIKPRALQSLRTSGKLPYSRIANKIYYNHKDIMDLIEKEALKTKI